MNPPQISLCELTIPETSFDEDVDLALAVGAQGLGVAEAKLNAEELPEQRRRLGDAGLAASIGIPKLLTFLPPMSLGWETGPLDPAVRLRSLVGGVQTLAELGPATIMCCTGPAGEFDRATAWSIVVDGIRTLAAVATAAGTKVAIEPMRESFRSSWTMVASLREMLKLLDDVGRDDVGMIFDTWHIWDSPEVHELLPEVVSRVHAVQICDYRDPTRGPMDRVIAGDGIAGIPGLLRELVGAGFDGWYDLECISDDGRFGSPYEDSLWKLPPYEFASRQVDGFLRCWAESSP